MGRGGVCGRCSFVARLGVGRRADTKAGACGTSGRYCRRTIGGDTRHEKRFPRGEVLSVCLFVQDRDSLLSADDVEVCLVCSKEWIARQQAVVSCGCHWQFVSTTDKKNASLLISFPLTVTP